MSPFKIGFRIEDYADILPPLPENEGEIINIEHDDINEQYWRKELFPLIISPDFIFQEAKRLKDGVWIMTKGIPIWIPPNYYQFLRYGVAGGNDPEFRLKRLKNIYTKIRVRKNPRFLGTYNIKNRQDGDTTCAMSDSLWEVHAGELRIGMIGIQSKTREDGKNPCWFNLQTNWINYPQFFLNAFYSHFASGDNIAEQLHFLQKPNPNDPNDRGRNVVIKYFPAVYNAMDGKGTVRRCILDEVNKWVECSFPSTFNNYMKFIMPGNQRKGIYDIFSSPADKNGVHNDEAYKFWQDSNPNDLQPTGSTKTRIYRMYSNPLDGIDGFYDKFGDADPQEVYEHILRERATKRPEKLMEEIRGFPLPILGTDQPNEEEIFGATDTASRWSNAKGIKARIVELKSMKEPRGVYGNLEWPRGTPDSGIPQLRVADLNRFDNIDSRWFFSHTELKRIDLSDLKTPPDQNLIEGCIGSDPFNSVNHTKNKRRQSMAAAVDWRFRDLSDSGICELPTSGYLARPWHKSLYHEDMIKYCLYTRSMLQYENSDGGELHDHFITRGYAKWLLDSKDKKLIETPYGFIPRKGDAPSGRGASAFMNEIIVLIDNVTNLPFNRDGQYLLKLNTLLELLEDVDVFDKDETLYNHFTMAWGQALLGRNKLLFQMVREPDEVNNQILEVFMG